MRPFFKFLIAPLAIGLMVSASLFTAAPQAHASGIPVAVTADFSFTNIGDWVENTISAVANPTTAASTYWTALKGSVLDPLAHALAQAVLKQITASVVNAINGTNGSPQFVTSLALNLQSVGDKVGLSFIAQFGSANHSPFSPAISVALRSNYLQQTSLAGFFSANQCTLTSVSPNINSYLAGNYSQGGVATWLSLTGPGPNNPFILYSNAKGQLASAVGSAQGQQTSKIIANNGFLSWCSSGSTDKDQSGLGQSCKDFTNSSDCNGIYVCMPSGSGTTGTCQQPTAATSDDTASTCYNKDGTPGKVETPGSVIHDSLSKVTGSGIDSLVSVHDFNQMIDTILSALITKVVSTGLSALSGSSSGGSSYTEQLGSSGGASDPNAAAVASQATQQAQTALASLSGYTNSWLSVQAAANTASSTVAKLIATCSDPSNIPQPNVVSDAQNAQINEIQPVFNQVQGAIASASSTQALALRVEADATAYASGTAGAGGSLTADTQALAVAPPTAVDIANAKNAASATGGATSTSETSLQVTGGTIVDQMNLIVTNAKNASLLCTLVLP